MISCTNSAVLIGIVSWGVGLDVSRTIVYSLYPVIYEFAPNNIKVVLWGSL